MASCHARKKQRTDEERDWKKVRGKVSTVFHSADSACFRACGIAVVAAAARELSLLANHQLFIKHFEPIKH